MTPKPKIPPPAVDPYGGRRKQVSAKAKPKKTKAQTKKIKAQIKKDKIEIQTNDKTILREIAGLMYATAIGGPTVTAIAEHPLFKGKVTVGALDMWRQRDNWTSQREHYLAQWRSAVEQTIGTELARARVEFLSELYQIRQELLRRLSGVDGREIPAARSYEGLVNALTRISEHIDSVQIDLAGTLSAGVRPDVDRAVSPEEARAAAREVLRLRTLKAAGDEDGSTDSDDAGGEDSGA